MLSRQLEDLCLKKTHSNSIHLYSTPSSGCRFHNLENPRSDEWNDLHFPGYHPHLHNHWSYNIIRLRRFSKASKITRTSNHFLCISPLLFTMALLFIFAFLPVYRGRCEDFTAAPCWGPGVCASGENKQKNAHCHCLLVGKIFVLILVPVSCTNSRRKGGSYMELKWLYSFKSLVWFYPWIYFVYSCQADRRDIYRLPSACKMLSKKFKNYVNWSGNFYNPVRGTDKFRYIFRWTLDLLLPWCSTVQYSTVQFIFRWTVDLLPSTHSDFVWSRGVYCPFCLSVSIAEANLMF